MSDKSLEHIAHGVIVPEDLRAVREVATFTGEPTEDGSMTIKYPPWFTRIGLRTAEIETGLGIVKVRAVALEEADFQSDLGYLKALKALLSIPDAWRTEHEVTLTPSKGRVDTLAEGVEIPSPREIALKRDPELARSYWEECMPPSLLQQVIYAVAYLNNPPLLYDTRKEDPSGE